MRSILPRWVFSGRSSRFFFEILVLIRPPLPVQRLHIPFFRIMLIIAHDADKINRSSAGFGGGSRKKNTDRDPCSCRFGFRRAPLPQKCEILFTEDAGEVVQRHHAVRARPGAEAVVVMPALLAGGAILCPAALEEALVL